MSALSYLEKDEADFKKATQKLQDELEHAVAITKKVVRPNPSNQYEMPHVSQANTALDHLLTGRVFGLLRLYSLANYGMQMTLLQVTKVTATRRFKLKPMAIL